MIAMLFCLSIPPAPRATVEAGFYEFRSMTPAQARKLVGVPTMFRVVLDSELDTWQGCRCFEVQMRRCPRRAEAAAHRG